MNKLIQVFLTIFLVAAHAFLGYAQQKTGDNLGNHSAKKTLDMAGHNIVDVSGMVIGKAVLENDNVALQIDGEDKAMLVPRVASLAIITNPVDGMLVYSQQPSENGFFMHQNGVWATFALFNLQPGQILVGDTNGLSRGVDVTGDLSLSDAGLAEIREKKVRGVNMVLNTVSSAKIIDGSVQNLHLADSAVLADKLANASVVGSKLADATVTTAKLAGNAVTAAKINSATAGVNKILTTNNTGAPRWEDQAGLLLPELTMPSLDNAQMVIGQIAAPASKSLTGDLSISDTGLVKIQPNAINSAKIIDGQVSGDDFANNTIRPNKISSSTSGALKVLKTNAAGEAVWVDRISGFAIGDIKAHIYGSIPDGWVRCDGQTVTDELSALYGKTLPDLNSTTYLMGSRGPSGENIGSNSLMLQQENLPNISLTGTLLATSGGTPAATMSINTNSWAHTHPVTVSPHEHAFKGSTGGFIDECCTFQGFRMSAVSGGTTSKSISIPTTTVDDVNNGGNHNHDASISWNALPAHTHTVPDLSINGGLSQTAVVKSLESVIVYWIMKIR